MEEQAAAVRESAVPVEQEAEVWVVQTAAQEPVAHKVAEPVHGENKAVWKAYKTAEPVQVMQGAHTAVWRAYKSVALEQAQSPSAG